MKQTKQTIDTVTSTIIGVTGMTVVHNIGGTMGGLPGTIAGTHTPTIMGLGLLANATPKPKKKR